MLLYGEMDFIAAAGDGVAFSLLFIINRDIIIYNKRKEGCV